MNAEKSTLLEQFEAAQKNLVTQSSDPTLQVIADWVTGGAIDLEPVFQRRERWREERQSALIESFLLNIPVPPIYLAEDELGQYQVIDGKQRITSIWRFLRDELTLTGLGSLSGLNGQKYSDLPLRMQTALGLRGMRAVVILNQSDHDVRYEVFTRLNTGGESLNDQEIRNVVYRGPLNKMIYDLAESEFLVQRLKITSKDSAAYMTMQDAEFVLRFMTLASAWRKFPGNLRDSMNHFMMSYRSAPETKLLQLKREFESALRGCELLWGERAFRRPRGESWRDQTLAGMYDAQMIAVHEVGAEKVAALVDLRPAVLEATRALFDERRFEDAVRVGTNTPSNIEYRTTRLIEMLLGLL